MRDEQYLHFEPDGKIVVGDIVLDGWVEVVRRIRATEALGEFEARIASRACATGMPPDNTAQFPRIAECLEAYARALSE